MVQPFHTPRELLDFKRSEPLTQAWAQLFADPTTQRLMNSIRLMAAPSYEPKPTPGLHPDTVTAHHWYFSMGVLAALDQMTQCAQVPSEFPDADTFEEEPFMHAVPEELRKQRT